MIVDFSLISLSQRLSDISFFGSRGFLIFKLTFKQIRNLQNS